MLLSAFIVNPGTPTHNGSKVPMKQNRRSTGAVLAYPNDDALRQALRRGEVDFIFGDAISLAFWINGTELRRMLRVLGRAVRREPLFRRGHRHRRAQGQRPVAAIAELGAVPALGKRPLHRSVAAVFFGEPVLRALNSSFRGDAKHRGISDAAIARRRTIPKCRVRCFASPRLTVMVNRPVSAAPEKAY